MSLELHTVEVIADSQTAQADRLLVGQKVAIANVAGASAGAAVTVAVAFKDALPASYGVYVNPGQDATWYVSGKTAQGFNVTLSPRLAANTLAAGAIDVLVVG